MPQPDPHHDNIPIVGPTSQRTEDSWYIAERTCFDELVRATGFTENTNIFLGYLPRRVNCIGFWTGGGDARDTWNVVKVARVMMQARVEGLFSYRVDAQRIAMKIVAVMCIMNKNNVVALRLASHPDVRPTEIVIGEKQATVYSLTIPMQMFYLTEGTAINLQN